MWQNVQFDFIRTLYDRSSLSVRVGHLHSPKVPFERKEVYVKAVHCLPYCYHSVFINDILPKPKKRLFSWEPKVEGLMFGDDIVVFARTADRLQELLDAIISRSGQTRGRC